MDPSDTHRKLTAILSADVAGYSRLMGADEEATIETLTAYRKVFLSYIENHRGRVVDAKGDAILAEFSSVVDAVSSAVEIQRELAAKNAALPDDRRMDFRIGINLGDVVVKDDVIYGDGVNVAARLESLAEPGGICISRPVYDQVESKLKLEYDFLGEQQVKNIAKPVRAYKVLLEPGQAPTRTERALRKLARGWRKAALAATVTVLVALVAALAWNLYRQSVSDSALAAFEKEAAFPLPNKPSIAVLAFDNLSGDPEQEYFSDGLSENLITTLAKIPQLFVIARNSSFKYKGQQVDVRQVGRELGVRYVLEGSVQKAGDHIRITAQLIDAATGNHLWAGSYDREQKDIFQVMDDVTWQVVKELEVKLTYGEMVRHAMKGTKNFAALEIYLKAVHKFTPL
ncbi:MAG: adenylate/guanylate cyclase domain-containing protein, partial [Candidatus Glassbacteria bacterium]|nr:adenylate/guanylate cyclase domain-containing protein [Candidatus Glassbacteria bacterium]